MDMDNNNTSWESSNTPGNDSIQWNNHTETMNSIYVFTPAGDNAKRVICSILATIGGVGFLGNCSIFFYLWQNTTKNQIQSSHFMKNLNMYIKSLALSDILSGVISVPLLCIQISFDLFQSGWGCKIVRYFNFIFPAITINNLVVISVEKFLSTRNVSHAFTFSTVRKMIITAWLLGLVVMLCPTAAFDGMRFDLNETHFTVICKNDEDFFPFKLTLIIFPLQYALPGLIVTYVNVSLMRTVWARSRRQIGSKSSNAFKANLRAIRIKGTTLLIALTFAFIIPYFFYITNLAYTQIAKPSRDFSTDYMIRYTAGGIAVCFSGLLNFVIYFAQMKAFRDFLKKRFCKRSNDTSQPGILSRNMRRLCFIVMVTRNVRTTPSHLTQVRGKDFVF